MVINLVNFKKLTSDIRNKNIESIENFAQGLEKADFYERDLRAKNTVLHLVFSSSDQDIISMFLGRMKDIGFSKEETIKILESQNKGGYNVIDKLLQIEEDINITINRFSMLLDSIKDNAEMLDIFLSVKGEEGSVYDALDSDEDISDLDTEGMLQKVQNSINHEGGKISISSFLPTIRVKTKDLSIRQDIFRKHFMKNALVAQSKENALEASIEQSQKALSDSAAIAIATIYASSSVNAHSNAPKVAGGPMISQPPANTPPVLKISKDTVDERMKEEASKINRFFKKDLQDPQNIMRKDIDKEYKEFCDGKIAAKTFKEKHRTKLYQSGLDAYFKRIGQLQEDKKLLLKPIDTPESLKAYMKYFSDRRITKTLVKSIDKIVDQVFAKEEVDAKALEEFSMKGEARDRIVGFAAEYAEYKTCKPSDLNQGPEEAIVSDETLDLSGLYNVAESVNTLAYNKEHIVWSVNKTLGYDISPSYEQNIGIAMANLGAGAVMSFISASPIPLASSALYSAGGVSGAAEIIMGEDHVDENVGAYVASNIMLSSAITGMAFCGPLKDVNKAACVAGVVSLQVASSLSKSVSDAYSLVSTGLMMGFGVVGSDAPLYMKSTQILSMAAKICHRISDLTEDWTSGDAQDTSGSASNTPQEPEVALGSQCDQSYDVSFGYNGTIQCGQFYNASFGQNISGQCEFFQGEFFGP